MHRCAAIGCDKLVPARMLMCRPHWFMVPGAIRSRIWNSYMPGQESDSSRIIYSWRTAVREALEAVRDKEATAA